MKIHVLIVAFLVVTSSFGQDIGIKREVKTTHKIDENALIFDKDSGQQIKFKEFVTLAETYPNHSVLVKDEDVNGNALSFYFVKNQFEETSSEDKNEIIQIKRNDIFDRLFLIEKVETKRTLIILQLDLQLPRINIEQVKEAEQAAISRGFTSIILTTTNANLSKDFAIEHNLKSVIIPNAKNVMDKFKSKRFPMYYILNKEKFIISSFKYSHEVEEELKKLD